MLDEDYSVTSKIGRDWVWLIGAIYAIVMGNQ